jgi:hypothetical protein
MLVDMGGEQATFIMRAQVNIISCSVSPSYVPISFDVSSLWWSNIEPPPSLDAVRPRSPRIAVIGAGAFWIANLKGERAIWFRYRDRYL